MTTCPSCGASILLQTDKNTCAQCGHGLVLGPNRFVIAEHAPPDNEEVRQQMRAALAHAQTFYREEEGREMTWEETPTGANYFLDGEYAGEARFQERPNQITEAIYITKVVHCPACKNPINATAHHDGQALTPNKDDITVCAHCVTILAYTEHGGLRLTTKKEIDALSFEHRSDIASIMRDLRIQKAMGKDTSHGLRGMRTDWSFEDGQE